MSGRHSWFAAVGVALAIAAPASVFAQQSPADIALGPVVAAPHITAPAPVLSLTLRGESAILGLRLSPVTLPGMSMVPVQSQSRQSQNVALMIVGGAGLIVGSIIDGDTGTIFMVGGGVVGLVGLYRYLS